MEAFFPGGIFSHDSFVTPEENEFSQTTRLNLTTRHNLPRTPLVRIRATAMQMPCPICTGALISTVAQSAAAVSLVKHVKDRSTKKPTESASKQAHTGKSEGNQSGGGGAKSTPMTTQAAARIQSNQARAKGGGVAAGSFAARAQAAAARNNK